MFFNTLGKVHMPSGKTDEPVIIDNKDGTVTVKYAPTETGLHEMHIKYNGSHIPGKSFHNPLLWYEINVQEILLNEQNEILALTQGGAL